MGCKHTKVSPSIQTSADEALDGTINCPHEVYFAKSQVTPPTRRLSGEEVLQQLRQEGIVPDAHASGGVAFSLPNDVGLTPRAKPPRRLERLPPTRQYTSEERQFMADIYRYDKIVEQVQKKALDRETKRLLVKKEKERRQNLKKMLAQQKVMDKQEKLKKFEEERATKRGRKAKK